MTWYFHIPGDFEEDREIKMLTDTNCYVISKRMTTGNGERVHVRDKVGNWISLKIADTLISNMPDDFPFILIRILGKDDYMCMGFLSKDDTDLRVFSFVTHEPLQSFIYWSD